MYLSILSACKANTVKRWPMTCKPLWLMQPVSGAFFLFQSMLPWRAALMFVMHDYIILSSGTPSGCYLVLYSFISCVYRHDWEMNGPMVAGLPPNQAIERLKKFEHLFEVNCMTHVFTISNVWHLQCLVNPSGSAAALGQFWQWGAVVRITSDSLSKPATHFRRDSDAATSLQVPALLSSLVGAWLCWTAKSFRWSRHSTASCLSPLPWKLSQTDVNFDSR